VSPVRFWLTAVLAALGFGGLVTIALPYDALGLATPVDRERAWLLTVWTAGVMAICFGVAGLVSAVSPIGVREIAESGSVLDAINAQRDSRQQRAAAPFYNFAGWMTMTGVFLLAVYFAGWLTLGR
jgi:hypothetical protein